MACHHPAGISGARSSHLRAPAPYMLSLDIERAAGAEFLLELGHCYWTVSTSRPVISTGASLGMLAAVPQATGKEALSPRG